MSKNILQALGKIDVALGGNTDDAANVIEALDQISERAGSLKDSVDNINTMELKVCESGEYDAETGVPTIEDPVKGTFYLTPAKNEEDNNIFNEYYVNDNGQWEMFGSASINVNDLFDLSDRMTKGVDRQGNIVSGAIIEGNIQNNKAFGFNSHAEGNGTEASGVNSHAEGNGTTASGIQSHAEGLSTTAFGDASHAEGNITTASGTHSHAEGCGTTASGIQSHAEGLNTIANHKSQHVFGENNIADTSENNATERGNYVEIVGNGSTTVRSNARTLDWSGNEILAGKLTVGAGPTENMDVATKQYVDEHAGSGSGSGLQNFVDGSATGSVRGVNTTAEGNDYTMGEDAVAEGSSTTASGYSSHAEGMNTTASGVFSHAEGGVTVASGSASHAEGSSTTASGYNSHAEGSGTIASGYQSHAEGSSTTANHRSQHVFGEFNIEDSSSEPIHNKGTYVEIVGNGTAQNVRSNARTLDWSGNEILAGKLTVGAGPTNNMDVATKQYVDEHSSSGGSGLQNFVDGSAAGSVRGIGAAAEDDNYTMGQYAVAEGSNTKASGNGAHAAGSATTASGTSSHTEGAGTTASGVQSHAEGNNTIASGQQSHAEGKGTTASGMYSHAEGRYTIANHNSQHVFGEYNIEDSSTATATSRGTYIEIVGNGTSYNVRSNARTLDWSGNETLAGSLTLGKGTADEVTITATQLKALLATLSS